MARIFIIDDHPIIREALSALLDSQPDFEVSGSAGAGREGVEQVTALRPDVVLLDLDLPDGEGTQFIPAILQSPSTPKVIIFTAYDSDDRLLNSIKLGAHGYIIKGAATADVVHAIRIVTQGGTYLEPALASKLMAHLGEASDSDEGPVLSDRERQVLRLVAEGFPNKQIAGALGITASTVKFHLSSIFTKLGVDNRAQAVAQAAQKGLI
jgi:two-component system, NarL family, response regulator LiaR